MIARDWALIFQSVTGNYNPTYGHYNFDPKIIMAWICECLLKANIMLYRVHFLLEAAAQPAEATR